MAPTLAVDLTDQLFVALRGDHFDAHDFVPQAVEKNAAVLLLDQKDVAQRWSPHVTCLLVKDTLKALQELAHYWRKETQGHCYRHYRFKWKNNNKRFLATIVGQSLQVTASQGSFNNHWGVPRTLLSSQKSDDVSHLRDGDESFRGVDKLVSNS